MRAYFILLLALVCICQIGYGQKEGNNWYFGYNAGVSFNGPTPVGLTDGALSTNEGCSAVSDSNGNLLFYTDGITVYNKTHNIMTNGTGLLGNSSSTQSGIIVRQPGSTTIYYVFTVGQQGGSLNYSIVDVSLGGGLGAVTVKNTQLLAQTTEKVTGVVHANCQDIWIIAHGYPSDAYYAYLLTPTAFNATPVVSNVGTMVSTNANNTIGYMKVSPDGTRLASAWDYYNEAQVLDFDAATGVVSNPITLSNSYGGVGPYGLEFSPNSQVLYIMPEGSNVDLMQYDLTAPNIPASEIAISGPTGYRGALQLGPDGRIYAVRSSGDYLDAIMNPNVVGTGCNYQEDVVYLAGQSGRLGLPAFIQSYFIIPTINFGNDTTICLGQTILLDATSDNATYEWQDGSTDPTYTVTQKGTYWVKVFVGCAEIGDTIEVGDFAPPTFDLGPDTVLCQGETLVLDATTPNGTYEWQDGSTNPTFTVTAPGNYWVDLTLNNCGSREEINVTYLAAGALDLGADTTVCPGETVLLDATTAGATYEWQDGSTDPTFTVTTPGTYSVEVAVGNCSTTDEIVVSNSTSGTLDLGQDTVLCQGETMVLDATTPNATYAWQDGSTDPTFTVTSAGDYWVDRTVNNCISRGEINVTYLTPGALDLGPDTTVCTGESVILDATTTNASYQWQDGSTDPTFTVTTPGTYSVEVVVSNCNTSDEIDIAYSPSVSVGLGPDLTLCEDDTVVLDATNTNASYEWHDGSTNATYSIDTTGNYAVTVTLNDCVASDEMDAVVESCKICGFYIPNAFSPNSDLVNDLFYARSNCEFARYELKVFDRWGEKVFETSDPTVYWDGTFRGAFAPINVYVYTIRYRLENQRREITTHGTLTLLR